MSNDTKDWANIRIEEPVRDEAREDDRTYTEIMRAGLETGGAGNEMPDPGDLSIPSSVEIDADIRDDLREQLDRIESAATTAEARTGRIEGTLEDMGAGR